MATRPPAGLRHVLRAAKGTGPGRPPRRFDGSVCGPPTSIPIGGELQERGMGKLASKVAVITGGSSGIGLAAAQKFVEEGAFVFITGRRQAELDKAVGVIGRNVMAVQGDVSDLDD